MTFGGAAGIPLPPPQHTALEVGFAALRARMFSAETLVALGVDEVDDGYRLPVLGRPVIIDLERAEVRTDAGSQLASFWAILTVHYLCAENLTPDDRWVSLGHFPDCRTYLLAFNNHVLREMLETVGRTRDGFIAAAESLPHTRWDGPGDGFTFPVFPRVPLTFVRHDGDEELEPGANVLYRADAARQLPAEDRIAMAELMLDVLKGHGMTE